jgi:glycosyltransferase involved in cell wall biosynthesis/GR25 family glycosyltransferase involved in LPS biosynthesis
LRNNHINFTLHEAINGYDGEPLQAYQKYRQRPLGELKRYPDFKEIEIKRGKPFIESAGAIGYIYTYLSILRDAKNKHHKRILILEDDTILDNNFHSKFERFTQSIPEEWKILQLGASQYEWVGVHSDKALKQGFYIPRRLDTCGSFAIALDHTIFDELIEAESAFESPFDHLSMGELYERYIGKCFVCYPNIIMPDVRSSSIRNERNQYTHAEKMRWPIENFQYPLSKPSIAIFIHNQHNIKYFDKFDVQENLPFQLRIYLNTDDGPRPVHTAKIFSKTNYQPVTLASDINLPTVDFVATITSQAAISENEIIDYLESRLLDKENKTTIQTLKSSVSRDVKERVSIIIPTYKRPYNLSKAIESTISQRYDNKEIIVVSDNGENSEFNKETLAIIDRIKLKNPDVSIKYISHKHNRNGAAARNTGLLHSTGEYICFLDDDDIYLDNRVSLTVERLKELPTTVGAVYCGFLGWNSPKNDENRYKAGNLTKDLLLLNYKNHYLHTNTATYRRNALLELNGFDETYRRHQDLELNLRFFEKFMIEYVKEPGVRLNPEPSEVSNKVFNSDMVELKQKFLDQFSNTINKFDQDTQKIIYKKQWEEVARYTTDPEATAKYFESLVANGPLQVHLLLTKNQSPKNH